MSYIIACSRSGIGPAGEFKFMDHKDWTDNPEEAQIFPDCKSTYGKTCADCVVIPNNPNSITLFLMGVPIDD